MSDLKMTEASPEEWRPTKDFHYKSGDRPLDGYTIKRGVGRGGFGEVYYAVSDGGKEVALKLIQRHLDVELRGVAQCLNLKNPHLVTLFDVRHSAAGENWVIMEYMAGPSLQERLQKAGGLPVEEAFHWLAGIASAIDYLHQNGIVHRDLKPGNVFGEGDCVKLGDYGLSKFISTSRRSGQTESVGTVHYMAPEISTGHYGKSIDVYSAAVIAFEMLSGEVPFDGESAGEILMKHLTAEPALGKIDSKYRPVFACALAKDPIDRYQSVAALLDSLRAAERGERLVEAPRRAGPISPPPIPGQRNAYAEENYLRYVGGMERAQAYEGIRAADLKNSLPPLPGTLKAKRRGLSDFLWSLFVAGALAGVLPALACGVELAFSPDGAVDSLLYVWIAGATAATCFGLLLLSRVWQAFGTDTGSRRLQAGVFGLLLGPLAFLFAAYVSSPIPHGAEDVVVGIGTWLGPNASARAREELWRRDGQYLIQYALLFGLALAAPDWGKATRSSRSSRFSLWPFIWAGAVALVLASALANPHGLPAAVVLALTAGIVQWASPYSPARRLGRRLAKLRKPVRPYA